MVVACRKFTKQCTHCAPMKTTATSSQAASSNNIIKTTLHSLDFCASYPVDKQIQMDWYSFQGRYNHCAGKTQIYVIDEFSSPYCLSTLNLPDFFSFSPSPLLYYGYLLKPWVWIWATFYLSQTGLSSSSLLLVVGWAWNACTQSLY